MILPFIIDIKNLPVIPFKNRGRDSVIKDYPVIFGIYKITSPSGSVYIGLSNDIYYRIHRYYKQMGCKSQKRIYNSLNKHGAENHIFEIMHILDACNLSKTEIVAELNKLERHYVSLFNSFSDDNPKGLNLTRGGDGMQLTQETWDRINNSKKGRKQSAETIEKRAKQLRGRKAYPQVIEAAIKANTGIIRSPETRQKLRDANLGKKQSAETIKKRVDTKKANGKVMSEEQRKKIGDSKRGSNNHWFGKPSHNKGKKMSDEQKKKLSKSLKGKTPWNKGLKMNPISVEKTASKNRGRKLTKEHIAKVVETKRIKREEKLKLKNNK